MFERGTTPAWLCFLLQTIRTELLLVVQIFTWTWSGVYCNPITPACPTLNHPVPMVSVYLLQLISLSSLFLLPFVLWQSAWFHAWVSTKMAFRWAREKRRERQGRTRRQRWNQGSERERERKNTKKERTCMHTVHDRDSRSIYTLYIYVQEQNIFGKSWHFFFPFFLFFFFFFFSPISPSFFAKATASERAERSPPSPPRSRIQICFFGWYLPSIWPP